MKNILLIAFLLLCPLLQGQKTIEASYSGLPLKTVLEDLESKTEIVFSYSEQLIKNLQVTIASGKYTISEIMARISEQTGLVLEVLSAGQIIVRKQGQSKDLCGYVINSSTNEPLAYATITLEGSNMGTISNEQGFFTLTNIENPKNGISIKVSYVGFYEKVVLYGNNDIDCPKIEMAPRPEALDEVVIYAYLNQGVNKNNDGSITMVQEDMGLFPGLVEPDILQSLQFIPGIGSLDESASGIQVRGGSADQNLILFDGIKMYNTGHFFGMLSAFNPYIIEHARIFKSGAPPEYGDRVSGVIDISSGEDIPQKLEGGAGLNGTHADLFLKTPIGKKAGLYLSGRRSYTDLIATPTFNALSEKVFQNTRIRTDGATIIEDDDDDDDDDDDTFVSSGNENFFFQDASMKFLLEPNADNNIHLSALYTKNDLDFSQFEDDDDDEITDRFIIENKGASFGWKGSKGGRLHHSLKGFYSAFDSDYNNTFTEDMITAEQSLRRNTVKELGVDASLAYDLLDNHRIRLGYQFSNTDVFFRLLHEENNDDLSFRNYDISRTGNLLAHSVYSEYRYFSGKKGVMSAGVRGSRYNLFDKIYVEPRLNADYPIFPFLRIKGTYEQRFQPISQLVEFEDIQLRMENNIWTLSNGDDIPVLKSRQYVAGFLLDKGGWTLDIEGYYKEIEGLTSVTNGFVTTSANNLFSGSSTIKGMDLLIKKEVEQLRLWLGYTFNDVVYLFEELQPTAFDGNNDIAHNLRMSVALNMGPWEVSGGFAYRTGGPFTPIAGFDPETGIINYGAINSLRLPDYHRLDISALYKMGNPDALNGEIGLSFNNVYSRQIPLSVNYRLDTNPNTGDRELVQVRQLSQGFTPNFVLRIYF